MTRFRTGAAVALAMTLGTAAAMAGPATIGTGELHPGMTGYGLTVFAGSRVDTFGVTVIGVQPNVRARGSMILVEVAGHGLELSAIAQGMSGSPIFIEGRLAGALAFGWGGALRPIAGVTPIDEMFAVPTGADPAAELPGTAATRVLARLAGPASADLAGRLGLPEPAGQMPPDLEMPSGWPSADAMARVLLSGAGAVDAAGAWICRPAGAAAAGAVDGAADTLVPGGACAVPLVLGDALLGAVGTVTWVEGDDVWMFGHPFMQRGPVALPLATAEILTVFPSREMSFKMGSIGQVVGAVHRDQRPGLVGELGASAPTVPVRVHVAGRSGERDYAFEVAEDPQLLPALVFWSAYNALLAEGDDASLQTVRLAAHTRWDAPGALGRDGLAVAAAASGPAGAAQLGPQLMAPLQILLQNPFCPVRLRGVDITVQAEPGLADARIVGVTGPQRLPAAGGAVDVGVVIEPRRGERRTVPVTLDVPAGLADQPYRLVAASAAELFALEAQRAAGVFDPAGFEQTLRLLSRERGVGTLSVALVSPGAAVVVGGRELDALPGSVARTVRRGVDPSGRTMADFVARRDQATTWILEGHAVQEMHAGRTLMPQSVEKRP